MAKPEWGTKRRCLNCSVAFYDFGKKPANCPKCRTEHHAESMLKPRRTRPEEKPVPPKPIKPVVVIADIESAEPADEAVAEELIEDASELGEDEDDVAEVIEGADDKPAEER
jgi:uncharacterized protein (TIGR02300 family)